MPAPGNKFGPKGGELSSNRRSIGFPPQQMATPAIDRIVHHSIIVEFGKDIKSVRMEEAARRKQQNLDAIPPQPQNVG